MNYTPHHITVRDTAIVVISETEFLQRVTGCLDAIASHVSMVSVREGVGELAMPFSCNTILRIARERTMNLFFKQRRSFHKNLEEKET